MWEKQNVQQTVSFFAKHGVTIQELAFVENEFLVRSISGAWCGVESVIIDLSFKRSSAYSPSTGSGFDISDLRSSRMWGRGIKNVLTVPFFLSIPLSKRGSDSGESLSALCP